MKLEFMKSALECAKTSDVDLPIAAVIVKDEKIIAVGVNQKERNSNAILHAEIVAISEASKKLGRWRLDDCEMYSTLEPCPMCASAIIQAHIKSLFFGAYDPNYGAFGSKTDMRQIMNYNTIKVFGGIMEDECNKVLKDFFEKIRND